MSGNSVGKLEPNMREIVPANNLERALGQLSESQLKDGANPFDAFKMLGEVFEVGFIFLSTHSN